MLKQSLFVTIIFFAVFSTKAEASLFGRCDLSNRERLNKNSFDRCTQKKLDAFYKELNAGPIMPKGSFDGKVQLAKKSLIEELLLGIFTEGQEAFLEQLWRGKVFYKQNANEAILFNRVFRDEGREGFPAHVYFGKSLFDSTRISIVIDYKYNQDIEGYNSSYDWLVNERGLAIRDEIRLVRKGLYLGRAYSRDRFMLNFVLEQKPYN